MAKKAAMMTLKCRSCGYVYKSSRRIKICRERVQGNPAMGTLGGYVWCRGVLDRVQRKPRSKPEGLKGLDVEIEHSQARLNAAITKVKKATTLVDRWQRRLYRLNKRRAALLAGQQPPDDAVRLITLDGEE